MKSVISKILIISFVFLNAACGEKSEVADIHEQQKKQLEKMHEEQKKQLEKMQEEQKKAPNKLNNFVPFEPPPKSTYKTPEL
ncbi:MAG: hypothetical protein PHV02_08145 [Rhodocyclaceae bacterium]|nr:hypothetical protein [Rhodocyclaceae bacterium]